MSLENRSAIFKTASTTLSQRPDTSMYQMDDMLNRQAGQATETTAAGQATETTAAGQATETTAAGKTGEKGAEAAEKGTAGAE